MQDDTTSVIRYVSPRDSAIDRGKSTLRTKDGRYDPAGVVTVPGKTPLVFLLRPLTFSDTQVVMRAQSVHDQMIRAVMFGLEAIENFPHAGAQAWRGTHKLEGANPPRTIWSDAELAEIEARFGWSIWDELGLVIWQRAQRGNFWGGSERTYTLPQWLWHELLESAPPPAA